MDNVRKLPTALKTIGDNIEPDEALEPLDPSRDQISGERYVRWDDAVRRFDNWEQAHPDAPFTVRYVAHVDAQHRARRAADRRKRRHLMQTVIDIGRPPTIEDIQAELEDGLRRAVDGEATTDELNAISRKAGAQLRAMRETVRAERLKG